MFINEDIICALATSVQSSVISIIRISGKGSISIVENFFSKKISLSESHKLHFGKIKNKKKIIDEVLVSIFHKNKSFTGEEMVEINCHASPYIVNLILQLLINNNCRLAKPGEFSMRAMLNNKLNIAQIEAIPDLINAETETEHKLAINQMREGYSNDLEEVRKTIIKFAALLELELDFAEENIEFANRAELNKNLTEIINKITDLIQSFKIGNAIKEGVQVVIVGKPNAGKSTLLNSLLNEEKAIVSDIPGTTRDTIEEQIIINKIKFRFIDTAGLQQTNNKIENIGIARTLDKVKKSHINICLFDITKMEEELKSLKKYKLNPENTIYVANKLDLIPNLVKKQNVIYISAKNKNLEPLKKEIIKKSKINTSFINQTTTMITNLRHLQCLKEAKKHLQIVLKNIEKQISIEFITHDLYQATNQIGEITGNISNDDILKSIFKDFCIGK